MYMCMFLWYTKFDIFFRIVLDNRFYHKKGGFGYLLVVSSGIKSNRGERLQLGPCLIFN